MYTCALLLSMLLLLLPSARAGIAILQPARQQDGNQPFALTLLVDNDAAAAQTYTIPASIEVTASADLMPPVRLSLQRDGTADALAGITLQPGEFRKISYRTILPSELRGMVRIAPLTLDAAPVLITLIRPDPDQVLASAPEMPATRADPPATAAIPANQALAGGDFGNATRISFNEPMFFALGNSGGHANAKFQLSFKYHVFVPDDTRSRGLLDNLYFAYTQFSLWDLQSPSAPFRDTNYRPSLYYFLPALGKDDDLLSRVAIASGLEHESNGRDGTDSRSLNMFFVRPSISFGDPDRTQLRITPKLYAYIGPLQDNPDIAQYRGHMDLNILLGQRNGIEWSSTLRKGTRSNYGSIDTTLSYPMARLVPGTAGYLTTSLFYGYGESLLTYNQKLTPQWRFGYSLWR